MGETVNNPKFSVAIIDPVGQKAGMDDYDLSLAQALKEYPCSIKIYSNFRYQENNVSSEDHFHFTFKKNIFHKLRFGFELISSVWKAKRNVSTVILINMFHFSFPDFLFIRFANLMGLKICMIVHDVESFVGKVKDSRLAGCIKMAEAVIVHNKTTFDELAGKVNVESAKKFWIIPHGDFKVSRQPEKKELAIEYFNLDQAKKYLLFFGMIKKSKGLDVLLEAMPKLPEHVHLIIAGRPRDISAGFYEEMIDRLNLTNRVHSYFRYITNGERHLLFNLADVAVLPYRRIYQSGIMLMAMSYGLPVIASDLPANREIINNRNGRLFKEGDSNDLALKLNLLIENEEELRFISSQSMEYVKSNHDWSKIAGQYFEILNSIK